MTLCLLYDTILLSMDNEKIKNILLDIYNTNLDFSVTMTGKESKRVNGLYKPDTHEILLHNKNFKNDNELLYTAIHEYTHHLLNEEALEKLPKGIDGLPLKINSKNRVHTNEFWTKFHSLLELAEQKGYYKINIEKACELDTLTQKIRKEYLEKNGILMQEFGRLLLQAQKLCTEAGIRYEDYVDRVLCLPRNAAHSITQVASYDIDTKIGYDNMKIVSQAKTAQDRAEATLQIENGKSPDTVVSMIHNKNKKKEISIKEQLEKEKERISHTIATLQKRLEVLEANLANL